MLLKGPTQPLLVIVVFNGSTYTAYRVLGEPEPGCTILVVCWGCGERIEILNSGSLIKNRVWYGSRILLKGPTQPLPVMVVFNGSIPCIEVWGSQSPASLSGYLLGIWGEDLNTYLGLVHEKYSRIKVEKVAETATAAAESY
jgi:hypothetical protein